MLLVLTSVAWGQNLTLKDFPLSLTLEKNSKTSLTFTDGDFHYQVACWRMNAWHYIWPGGGFYGAHDIGSHAATDPCIFTPSYSPIPGVVSIKTNGEPFPIGMKFSGRIANDRLEIPGQQVLGGPVGYEFVSYKIISKIPVEGKKEVVSKPDTGAEVAPPKVSKPADTPCKTKVFDGKGVVCIDK